MEDMEITLLINLKTAVNDSIANLQFLIIFAKLMCNSSSTIQRPVCLLLETITAFVIIVTYQHTFWLQNLIEHEQK